MTEFVKYAKRFCKKKSLGLRYFIQMQWSVTQKRMSMRPVFEFKMWTRKHSSRMRFTHLETLPASVSVASTRCCSRGSPNEQIWTGLQWSPPNVTSTACQVWCPGVPNWPFPGGATLPCDLSHDAFDVTYPSVNRQIPVKTLPSRKGICGQ